MGTPKVGDLVRMTRTTDWSPRPAPPYEGSAWPEGTTLQIVAIGGERVVLKPLRNEQRIRVGDYYMWNYVEPI